MNEVIVPALATLQARCMVVRALASAEQSRHAALELVRAASRCDSREALAAHMFQLLDRLLGFDRGCLLSFQGAPAILVDTAQGELRCQSAEARESPLAKLAGRLRHQPDVAVGLELCASITPLMAAKVGARSLALLVRRRGEVCQVLEILRLGAAFSANEAAVASCLQPAFALGMRAVAGSCALPESQPTAARTLSRREREIVALVGRGLQNMEIANVCGTSRNTVRNQLAKVFRKLEVSTRAELVSCAAAHGLLPEAVTDEHNGGA